MSGYGWHDAPLAVRTQVEGLRDTVATLLGSNLTGMYLHGSLAMGCFNPDRSDLDLLVTTERPLRREHKCALALAIADRSNAPRPVQLSVLAWEDVNPWRHPAPYQFYYSETWRVREQRGGTWLTWPDGVSGTDPDLAAHIATTRARGIVLTGRPIDAVLPQVPEADYRAAILEDARWRMERIAANPVHLILNLCRVYHVLRDGGVDSKEEGGRWALGVLRSPERALVRQALAVYRGEIPEPSWNANALSDFATTLWRRIEAANRRTR